MIKKFLSVITCLTLFLLSNNLYADVYGSFYGLEINMSNTTCTVYGHWDGNDDNDIMQISIIVYDGNGEPVGSVSGPESTAVSGDCSVSISPGEGGLTSQEWTEFLLGDGMMTPAGHIQGVLDNVTVEFVVNHAELYVPLISSVEQQAKYQPICWEWSQDEDEEEGLAYLKGIVRDNTNNDKIEQYLFPVGQVWGPATDSTTSTDDTLESTYTNDEAWFDGLSGFVIRADNVDLDSTLYYGVFDTFSYYDSWVQAISITDWYVEDTVSKTDVVHLGMRYSSGKNSTYSRVANGWRGLHYDNITEDWETHAIYDLPNEIDHPGHHDEDGFEGMVFIDRTTDPNEPESEYAVMYLHALVDVVEDGWFSIYLELGWTDPILGGFGVFASSSSVDMPNSEY